MGPLDMPEVIEGVAFETLFFQELMAVNNAFRAYKDAHTG